MTQNNTFNLKPEMQEVIDKLLSLGGKPIETLDAAEARLQPTPTDAVIKVLEDHQIQVPKPNCEITNMQIPVTGGYTTIRVYTPKTNDNILPIIVYYHGGGFVIADLDVYNSSPQSLCEQTGALVISVEYPKGPEHKFPMAHQVATDAYKWILSNAISLKGDPKTIAVVGESAGGNLALNISIMARDSGVTLPVYQVLVYPLVGNDTNNESYTKNAHAKPLNKAMIQWFVQNYFESPDQTSDPRVNLVNANLSNLPNTLIIAAEVDTLMSEGQLLNQKLTDAGVKVEYKLYQGVTHEFFGMGAFIPEAKEAMSLAVQRIKEVFNPAAK
jgi:acetyl esterase